MAEPSSKSPKLTRFLDEAFGRSGAIKANVCISPPMGCGGPALEFRSPFSRREYAISGLCQACQDKYFESNDG